jgi:transcriptional regulator with XRE-family HTH domain
MNMFLENVDELLKQKGKRRTWISGQTGIALSTINSWFSKDILPRVDDALKVAQILNVSLDYLITGKGKPAGNDPALQNIINFLKEQNHDTLVRIESSLTLFNYTNMTQDMESTPALMLDKNLYITWVNDKFLKVFGQEAGVVGSRFLPAGEELPAIEYAEEPTDETPSPAAGLQTDAESGSTGGDELVPLSGEGEPPAAGDRHGSAAMLRNIILIPIYKSYRSRKDLEMPQGYAGVFVDINQDNRYVVDNIFLKLAEISIVKEKHSISKINRLRKYIEILCRSIRGLPEYPEVSDGFVQDLIFFAPMHDIGKIGIPDDILNKERKLEDWEWQLVKEHTINGAYILSAYPNPIGKQIALQHHEKWDGSGYPYGLSGTMIALSARITSICITYDAIMSERTYRDANTHEEAMKIITGEKGRYFEPLLVDKFLEAEPQIKQVAFEIE